MTIGEGQTVSIEFQDNPIRVQAFLVDYDADVPVGYPLEEVSKNTFRVTPEGIKTLEVQAAFPGNKQIFLAVEPQRVLGPHVRRALRRLEDLGQSYVDGSRRDVGEAGEAGVGEVE